MSSSAHAFLAVVDRVRLGHVTIDEGERLAAAPAVAASLTREAVGAISEASFEAAIQQGKWFEAQVVQRLLVTATEQLPDDGVVSDAYRMRQVAAGDWVEIAHSALVHMPSPDGRLLVAARSRGERAVARARQVGHPGITSTAHFRLGTLHLDPYTGRASPLTGPFNGQPPWQDGYAPELGNTVLGVGSDHWHMPDPIDALQYSADHLRLAYSGEVRTPGAAKALAQTLDSLAAVGHHVAQDEVLAVCRDALDELHPTADQATFEEVSEILARRS